MESSKQRARRGFVLGAAAAGVALGAVATLPHMRPESQEQEAAPDTPPDKGGGYRLSEHVQRYYRSTRL